ncbi:TonB-dependent receptor [Erythrobacter ani]|uniref:TonB-dependent receptor n=1 Tax=Erythrobacter ani TaxID=2827235 RepID=A0ABS6SKT8_9SPHN|nr:TonB-dependent receptor [Erythrobacter ani]MBV7265254.1 TonB-dependent receptor [Erythrobacter ani]
MKIITSRIALATALSCAFGASAALAGTTTDAETASAEEQQSQREADRQEAEEGDPHYRSDILVSADGLQELDFIAGQDVIGPDVIQRDLTGQIGDLLVKIPGVSATSFAPGSSRPILRGLDAERVRVLIDGVGTADVANTSADHATPIDPLTTARVEVLRGPTALLYGSQAIGGVVNVIDRRIPIEVPENGVHVDALTAFDTVSDLRSGGASIDVAAGESVVFHLDGSFRETNDLEIPGFQIAPELRAELLAEVAEEEAEGEFEEAAEIRDAANQTEFLPNSATETWTVNGGVGFFFGDSTIGASVGYFDTDYGVVGRPGAEHAHGEEEGEDAEEEEEGEEVVTIGLEQLRVDFRGDIALGSGFLSRLKLRGVYSDYEHTEFEGAEVGTVFETETVEVRAELLQQQGGVIGAQFVSRDFAAVGEEAFVAPNETTSFAIFTAQEVNFDGFQIEGAARYENVDVSSDVVGVDRNFDLFSGALSFVAVPGDGDVRLGLTGSRSERAPAGEELFANGPHIATQAFEIGDPTFDTESAWGLEAFARGEVGEVQFSASVYAQWFDDFIFLQPNGEEEDDLPVFLFLQEDANFFGFEGQVTFPLVETNTFGLSADLRAEYVEAELDDDTNVPRIPPFSLLGALDAEMGQFDVRGEVQWFAEQDEIATFETPTDDFALVNLYVSWRPLENNRNVVLQLAGENLFDTTGRRHSSFTKDFVPLPGQNIRASVRLSF